MGWEETAQCPTRTGPRICDGKILVADPTATTLAIKSQYPLVARPTGRVGSLGHRAAGARVSPLDRKWLWCADAREHGP
jgi:hypothetical protein